MTAPDLTAEDLELARQIALRKGYLAQPWPASPALSLRSWHRQRFMVLQELSALELRAIASHGTVAALLAAATLPGPVRCLDDAAFGEPVPAIHCPCAYFGAQAKTPTL